MQDLFSVTGKTAIITGGSAGIGLAMARGLVEAGARVYIVARRADELARRVEELNQAGFCRGIQADVSSMAGLDKIAQEFGQQEDQLNILVNNAGILMEHSLDEFPESDWDKTLDINLKAPFFLTQKLLPLLRKAASADDPARVVHIGSLSGMRVQGRQNYSYYASKAGLHHLALSMARHLGHDHINVVAIAPGPFPVDSTMHVGIPDEIKQLVCDQIPSGRLGKPEDIAGTLIYVASKAGAYTNGMVLAVDGGFAGAAGF